MKREGRSLLFIVYSAWTLALSGKNSECFMFTSFVLMHCLRISEQFHNNTELNASRIIICLKKSEVAIERISV